MCQTPIKHQVCSLLLISKYFFLTHKWITYVQISYTFAQRGNLIVPNAFYVPTAVHTAHCQRNNWNNEFLLLFIQLSWFVIFQQPYTYYFRVKKWNVVFTAIKCLKHPYCLECLSRDTLFHNCIGWNIEDNCGNCYDNYRSKTCGFLKANWTELVGKISNQLLVAKTAVFISVLVEFSLPLITL